MTNNKDSLNDFFNSIGGEKKKIKVTEISIKI